MRLRIPITTIDSFNYALLQEDQDTTEYLLREFAQGLTTRMPPTERMELGTAFGECVKAPILHYSNGAYTFNGYTFPPETIDIVRSNLDIGGTFEVPCSIEYECLGDKVIISGRADYLIGTHAIDLKTRKVTSPPKPYELDKRYKKYIQSVQWMMYCKALGIRDFTYQVYYLEDGTNDILHFLPIQCEYSPTYEDCIYESLKLLIQFLRTVKLTHCFELTH